VKPELSKSVNEQFIIRMSPTSVTLCWLEQSAEPIAELNGACAEISPFKIEIFPTLELQFCPA
jgi:hypothetical protein